jgi:hypothetical protein
MAARFHDTPDDAMYRLDTVKSWKIKTAPMRYQPLDALEKKQPCRTRMD